MTKSKDAPSAPPAEIIPPDKSVKSGRAKAALAKLGLVDANAAERDPELEGLMSEIESDLREEELRKIWQRYGKFIAAVVIIVIAGIGGFSYWRQHQEEQRLSLAAAYDQAMKDIENGKTAEGLDGLAKIGSHAGEGYASVADLQRAAVLLKQNDVDGAIAIYKAMAADPKTNDDFRQLAIILEVLHSIDRAPANTLETQLTPMLSPSNPFSPTAMELSAALAAKEGDTARAIKILDQILESPEMPQNLVARAKELKAYYSSLQPAAAVPVKDGPAKADPVQAEAVKSNPASVEPSPPPAVPAPPPVPAKP